jgi:hypothetical protein
MDYIKKNIIKINFILILSSLILLPLFFYINFNFSSQKTYEKTFYTLKSGVPSVSKKIELNRYPIINDVTLNSFLKTSINEIFNYSTIQEDKIEHIKNIEKYFTPLGYRNFKGLISEILTNEEIKGVILNKSVINQGPYLLGVAKILGGDMVWKYVLKTKEIKKGTGGNALTGRRIEVILKEMKFSRNNQGIAIDSIMIR